MHFQITIENNTEKIVKEQFPHNLFKDSPLLSIHPNQLHLFI